MNHEFLLQAEIDLEELATAQGAARLIERLEAEGATSSPNLKVLRGALPVAAKAITSILADSSERRGDHKTAEEILSLLPSPTLALIGLTAMLGQYGRKAGPPTMQAVINHISAAVETEFWAYSVANEDPKFFRWIVDRQMRKATSRPYRVKGAKGIAELRGMENLRPEWSLALRTFIAQIVINGCLATGLFEVSTGDGALVFVVLTKEAEAMFLEAFDQSVSYARPALMPMLVPARRWEGWRDGGYILQSVADRTALVSSHDRGRNKLIKEALADGSMVQVIDALDHLGSTGFRLNTAALGGLRVAVRGDLKVRKLPGDPSALKDPEAPEGYSEMTPEEQKGWRIQAGKIRGLKRSMTTDRVVLRRSMDVADLIEPYPAFYLPHNLDWRGRVYPMPTFNHHRADYIRGLFEFAEGDPLGDHGAEALAIHAANTASGPQFGKVDKLPLDGRIAWAAKHNDLFREIHRHGHERPELWTGVDAPFSFLAAASEMGRLIEWTDAGSCQEAFVSNVPCALDGTNSGVQHYAAIMRSKQEADYVNLLPGDRPHDLYGVVADRVLEDLRGTARIGDDHTLAVRWLEFGVDRSIVKRQVMTYAYSSEVFGFAAQIRKDLMLPLEQKVILGEIPEHPFGEDNGFAASIFLARRIWDALQGTLPRTSAAMQWIKSVAWALAKEGHPLQWTSPVGLPVLQRYQQWKEAKVNLFLSNTKVVMPSVATDDTEAEGIKRVQLAMRAAPTGKLVPHKQKNGAAPNVIHSMDGAHLVRTAAACKAQGIPLITVHDSFATTAGRTHQLSRILREEFAGLYVDYCPLAEIDRYARSKLSDAAKANLPPLPEKGDLDLSEVLGSPYCFS